MTTTLPSIQNHLDNAKQPNSMRDLFCQTLSWGKATGAGQTLPVGAPVNQTLTARPVAQLGTLPVFRIDWPDTKLPNVTQRRAVYHRLSQTSLEHLLCYVTSDGKRLAFVWARDRGGKRVELRTLPYEVGAHARTTIERLQALAFRFDEFDMVGNVSAILVADRLNAAFDVEAVTREFFTHYREAFQAAERSIIGIAGEARRLFTQKLFNRLMFIVFLERKGWLTFGGRKDYLRALWEAHLKERQADPQANFYTDRLKLLFFAGLNTPHEVNVVDINRGGVLANRIGQVPYLNGGLFEEEGDDKNDAIKVPDDALDEALSDLFYRFNFTVSESTPLDIEVAVDPEMLGKVFEELVTGRHESGSYYTPRPIVAFMCREGLKGYLTTKLPHEKPEVIARFVDERGAADLRDPEAALATLKAITVCDPACGSGAYLLGMLQELLSLRAGLFRTKQIDTPTNYVRKLEIIQNNIYGVDLDPFAVNIARLRLWLSLVVDYEGDNPPPLPNLDFKVEAGDSLQAPDPSGGLQIDMFRQQQIDDYFALKERYLQSHHGEKQTLKQQVETKKREIVTWARPRGGVLGFDWAVEFAEVFAEGGFDIVVANPPYVRQELIKEQKPTLQKIYPEVYTGTADLYVYFYARAFQMLDKGGRLVFISSNKWMRAGYGEKLREMLATKTQLQTMIDFRDLPVFGAIAYPVIVVAGKQQPAGKQARVWAPETLERINDLRDAVDEEGQDVPASSFGTGGWSFGNAALRQLLERMKLRAQTLGKLVNAQIYMGAKTGYNEAFVISRTTRDALIAADGRSAEAIKPFLRGRDVKRWIADFQDIYLIRVAYGDTLRLLGHNPDRITASQRRALVTAAEKNGSAWKTFQRAYPAVAAHLKPFEVAAKRRQDQGDFWWELRPCDYYSEFERPKILYPDISKSCAFTFDTAKRYSVNTTYFIPSNDLYLLGVLNSSCIETYYTEVSSQVRGGFLRFFTQFVLQLPIPNAPADERAAIAALAQKCLDAKGQGAKVKEWEAEIDERVARLYGLDKADLKAIKGE